MIFDLLLIVLLGPIGLAIVILRHLGDKRKKIDPRTDKDWYLSFSLSKEDAVSQLFILLSFLFLGVTLLAFNRDFGNPVSWQTILFITSAIGLAGSYYLKTVYTLVFSLVGLTSWWGAQAMLWIDKTGIGTAAIYMGLLFVALLFYSLGRLHEGQTRFKRFALAYLILGIISVTGSLFFLSTKSGISALGDMTKGLPFLGSWQLALSLFVFWVSFAVATYYAAAKKLLSNYELYALAALSCLFGLTAFLPEQNMFLIYSQELSVFGIFWAFVYNFAIFFELLGLILLGYLRREAWLINLGAAFLFLLVIVKYFDWFFTSFDKSLFFIGAGILLFGVGWSMEKGRRYMISSIRSREQQITQ